MTRSDHIRSKLPQISSNISNTKRLGISFGYLLTFDIIWISQDSSEEFSAQVACGFVPASNADGPGRRSNQSPQDPCEDKPLLLGTLGN
jgi:hypothetical protein